MASIYGANIDTSTPAPDAEARAAQAVMSADLEKKAARDAAARAAEALRAEVESARQEDQRRASWSRESGLPNYIGVDKQVHPVAEPSGVVVPRVLGAAPPAPAPGKYAWDETQRFDEEQVPIAPQIPGGRAGEKTLGPGERAIEDIARPPQEKGSGIRFAIGGKWYEQTRTGYVPVDQTKTDKGSVFTPTGPEASPEVMSDIRRQVRSQGAFGKELPASSGEAGGFSPSPRVEDVAVMPDSAIEDIAGKTQMRGYEKVLGDLERIPDEALPAQMRGLGLTRQDVRQLMLAQASHPQRTEFKGGGAPVAGALRTIDENYYKQVDEIDKRMRVERDPARLERLASDKDRLSADRANARFSITGTREEKSVL